MSEQILQLRPITPDEECDGPRDSESVGHDGSAADYRPQKVTLGCLGVLALAFGLWLGLPYPAPDAVLLATIGGLFVGAIVIAGRR